MKKAFPILLLALFCAATTRGNAKTTHKDAVTELDSCWAVLQEFMSDPATAVPAHVWQQARAVMIVNQFKGGFIFGVKGGYGVIMVKKPGGHWSLPVLLSANEESLGLQLGAKSVETVYIITDDQTPRRLFTHRFNIGVDAKAVAGPHDAEAEKDNHPLLAAPVLVYRMETGLFAGATVKATQVTRDDDANFALYNTTYTLPELLYSDWVSPSAAGTPDVQSLMDYVQRLAP